MTHDEIRFATALFAPVSEPGVTIDVFGYYRFGDRKARVLPSVLGEDRWILYINEGAYPQRYLGDLWCGCRWERESAELAAIAWCVSGIMPEMR